MYMRLSIWVAFFLFNYTAVDDVFLYYYIGVTILYPVVAFVLKSFW